MRNTLFGAMALALLLLASELRAVSSPWQDLSVTRSRGQIETGARQYLADEQMLRDALARAPQESSGDRSQLIQLPLADGRIRAYAVVEAPVLAPAVAARYPLIKSYKLFDAADGRVVGRLSSSPAGLRAVLRTDKGRVFVDPRDATLQDQVYVARSRANDAPRSFHCGVNESHARDLGNWLGVRFRSANRVAGALLRYDLAVAVTLEYYQYFGSNDATVMTAINDTITRVNEIYERDLGITFQIVSDDALYEKSESGRLDNNSADVLLTQVKGWIDDNAPGLNYDLGHMFSRPGGFASGGGLAFLGGVCDAERKAGGVSGLNIPLGDPFDVDYVAHEIGHQFDAEHSFNGTTGSCGTGRWPPTAYEPGSGSTIMGYAGLCRADMTRNENLQDNTSPTFHAGSIAQINSFVQGEGNCFTPVALMPANTDPVIAPIGNKPIPANTPFILGEEGETGRATDADLDTLTYQWDQMDTGCPTDSNSLGTDNGSNALFRSYEPRGESWRNFPALGTQLRARYDQAETLPCQQRDLNFRLTARDQRSGQDTADVRLSVDSSSGPFAITTQTADATITAGSAFLVRWDVASTNLAPVNCDNVDIDLLTFAGSYSSYSVKPLASMTLNDGIASVSILPVTSETRTGSVARIRVKCSDNVFYALSEGDLTVVPLSGPATTLDDDDFATRSFVTPELTSLTAPVCPPVAECATVSDQSGARSGGSGSVGWGLLALAVLAPWARRRRAQILH